MCIAWLRDLQSETFVYLALKRKGLIVDLSDEYIFGYVQRVLTSNHCFWQGKHDLIYHHRGIPVNTILFISVSAFHG